EPRVLLLDEPTRSLDPLSARRFREFLRSEIARGQGCTVLLATHSSEEAMELCDRVGVLDKGRLLALGTTSELARRFGDQRYLIWTRSPRHPALRSLATQGRIAEIAIEPAEDAGWSCVQVGIPGGLDGAERTLDYLKCAGMDVARFERATMTLADLIDRVITSERREAMPS
ncbi:MAG TPA: AAA family ATPase, partial [Gemmatimonadaceae bacterium]|nr:AAA family ATPase [Gemmatimonadaceae bacterium]